MSKRKANSCHRRMQRFHDALFRQNHLVVVGADVLDGKCVVINFKTGAAIQISDMLANALAGHTFKWNVLLAAFGKTEHERYMKAEEWPMPSRFYQRDLAEGLNDAHKPVIAQVNPHHYMGAGWIGSPTGQPIDDSRAYELFELLGVWEGE